MESSSAIGKMKSSYRPMEAFSLLIIMMAATTLLGAKAQREFRLPLDLIPSHYGIEIRVRPTPADDFSFEGVVKINFTCVSATDIIVLHNYELAVDEDNVVLMDSSGRDIGVTGHDYEWSFAEFQTISLEEPLEEGEGYTLTIPYSGFMVTYPAGMWWGSYFGDKGDEYYVATQMQATSARAVYPCFDEPGLKATFDIVVGHPVGTKAFSNMREFAEAIDEEEPGYLWQVFERTPVMSTYLVAIIVGQYSRVSTPGDSRQFILVRDEAVGDTAEAIDYVPQILRLLEEKLQTPFPLRKLDHAGVLFFGGGMENYGLIVYDEFGIADAGEASLTLMAHETAHMWTGDLVTCQWWDVTWLNEGMTHFFTYYISNLIAGDIYDYMAALATDLMDTAMAYDTSANALPMVVPINEPRDIGNAFSGSLIYSRGGNIGRVMYNLLGETAFMLGMKNYFAANSYQPVREQDLFDALNDAADGTGVGLGLPDTLGNVMLQWTNQPGYPLVTVARRGTINGTTTLLVSQKRHIGVSGNDHDDGTLWPIGLTWSSEPNPEFDNLEPKLWLTTASEEITLELGEDQWIIFNNERTGYYRVNYERGDWLLILEALEGGQIPSALTRAALYSDVFELCFYDLIDSDVCLGGLHALKFEKNLNAWSVAAKGLQKFIAKAGNQRDAVDRIIQVLDVAEFNAMRSREVMTPKRKRLLDFFTAFREHLVGPDFSKTFYSIIERVWNKRFETQSEVLQSRLEPRSQMSS